MPKKGENIYKRKDGRWEGRYKKTRTKDGKIIYGYVYGHKYVSVQQELIKQKMRYDKQQDTLFLGTVSEWFDEWLYFYIKDKVKHSTWVSYEMKTKNHIRPYFKNKILHLVTQDDINKFVHHIMNQELSENTVKNILQILKNSFSFATKKGFLPDNPTKNILLTKKQVKSICALTMEEQRRLEYFAFQEKRCSAVIIALATGMRIGEICGLKWSDIDFNKGVIYVQRSLQRLPDQHEKGKTNIFFGSPKTKNSIRSIPLASHLSKYLQEKKQLSTSDFVISVKDHHAEPRTVTYRFKKCLRQSGIDDIHFHVLRHTFATRCVELGVDIASLSKLMGHHSIKLTLDTYTDSLWEKRQEAMNILDQNIFINHEISEDDLPSALVIAQNDKNHT